MEQAGVTVRVRAFGVLQSALPAGPVTIPGADVTVGEVLAYLCRANPDLREALFEADGQLQPWVQVYLSGENIRHLQQLATRVPTGAEILVLRGDIVGG